MEADLAAGAAAVLSLLRQAAGRLGYAREREVRMLDGVRSLRARRAYCRSCETTHVLLPAWSVPRRRDGAEAIGSALLDNARGRWAPHDRRPAWSRPAGTVRGWLRAFARRAETA